MTRGCERLDSSVLLQVVVKFHTFLFESISERHVWIYGTLTTFSISGPLTSS